MCIFGLRRIKKQIPAALVMLLLTTFLTWVTDASRNYQQTSGARGIKILGELQASLPKPRYDVRFYQCAHTQTYTHIHTHGG